MSHKGKGREAKLHRQENAQVRQVESVGRSDKEQLAKLESEGHRFCKEAERLRKSIRTFEELS